MASPARPALKAWRDVDGRMAMRVLSLTTLSAALLLAVPAAARTTAQAEPDQSPTAKPSVGEQKICKKLKVTGSRMGDRVCLTRDEWKRVDEQK